MIIQGMPGDRSRSHTCVNDLIVLVGSLRLVHRYFNQLIIKRCLDSGSPLADVDDGRSGSTVGVRLLTY